MKNFYSLLAALLLALLPTSASAYDFMVDGIAYNYNSDGISVSVTYTAYQSSNNYSGLTDANIPSSVTYNGSSYPVTSIDDYAFCNCVGLTSVTIPSTVTVIGHKAFSRCSGLEKVNITDLAAWCSIIFKYDNFENDETNPLENAHHLFLNENEIKNLVIPNTVTSIFAGTFKGCSGLTSVTISNAVTFIGFYAFYGCRGLTSVTIGNSVTYIDEKAFCGCDGLMNVVIGESVRNIGPNAFDGCYNITSVKWDAEDYNTPIIDGGGIYTSNIPFYSSSNNITFFEFGDKVKNIPAYICYEMNELSDVTIGKSVTSIHDLAFNRCNGPTKLIWNAVNCTSNASMPTSKIKTVVIGNQVQTLPSRFVIGSKITSLTIPNSVTSIGDSAFYECRGIKSLTFPNSVTSIGDYAFYCCDGLKGALNIPGSITDIGDAAFSGCLGLMTLKIGNSTGSTVVGDEAFKECEGLTSIYLPASLSALGESAFEGCTGLTDVYCYRPRPINIDATVFKNVPVNGGCDLHVPEGSKIRYEAMPVWQDFMFILEDAEDPGPSPNPTNGDVNGDGKVNVSDVTALINIILGII